MEIQIWICPQTQNETGSQTNYFIDNEALKIERDCNGIRFFLTEST